MNVSPLDLRQQRFHSRFRGLDKVEVTAFLSAVADDYEQALRETDQLRQEVARLEAVLKEHREHEQNLRSTLTTAQRLSDDIKATAEKEADRIVREAEGRSQLLLDKTRRGRRRAARNRRHETQAPRCRDHDRIDHSDFRTPSQFRRALVNGLYDRMVNARLGEMTQRADAPFAFASTNRGAFRDCPRSRSGLRRAFRLLIRQTATGVELDVRVIPRARETRITGERDGALLVRVAAPPVDDAANDRLIDYFARLTATSAERHPPRQRCASPDEAPWRSTGSASIRCEN
jgi:cell division initiation protein